jgi:hypothetical protein
VAVRWKTDDELVKDGDHRYGKVCAIAAHGASPSSDDNAATIQAALTVSATPACSNVKNSDRLQMRPQEQWIYNSHRSPKMATADKCVLASAATRQSLLV